MACLSSLFINLCLSLLVAISNKIEPTYAWISKKGIMENQTKYIGDKVSILMYEVRLPHERDVMHYGKDAQLLKWIGEPKEKALTKYLRYGWLDTDVAIVLRLGHTSLYKTIKRNGRWVFRNAVAFVLTGLRKDDEGFYTCIVRNRIGQVYATMYLSVIDPHEVALAKENARREAQLSKEMLIMVIALAVIAVLAMSMVVGVLIVRRRAKNHLQNQRLNNQLPRTLNIAPVNAFNANFSEREYSVVNTEERTGMYLVIDKQDDETVEAPTPPPRPTTAIPAPSTTSADSYYIW